LCAGRDRKELKADIVSLRAGFRDRPDRILGKHRIAFDSLVEIALKLCDGHPRALATAALLALIGDTPVVRLVVALEREQRAGFSKRLTCFDQLLHISPTTDQSPTQAHAGFAM